MNTITKQELSDCLNDWMRQFTDDPELFESEYATVKKFLMGTNDGETPTYGELSAELIFNIKDGLNEV